MSLSPVALQRHAAEAAAVVTQAVRAGQMREVLLVAPPATLGEGDGPAWWSALAHALGHDGITATLRLAETLDPARPAGGLRGALCYFGVRLIEALPAEPLPAEPLPAEPLPAESLPAAPPAPDRATSAEPAPSTDPWAALSAHPWTDVQAAVAARADLRPAMAHDWWRRRARAAPAVVAALLRHAPVAHPVLERWLVTVRAALAGPRGELHTATVQDAAWGVALPLLPVLCSLVARADVDTRAAEPLARAVGHWAVVHRVLQARADWPTLAVRTYARAPGAHPVPQADRAALRHAGWLQPALRGWAGLDRDLRAQLARHARAELPYMDAATLDLTLEVLGSGAPGRPPAVGQLGDAEVLAGASRAGRLHLLERHARARQGRDRDAVGGAEATTAASPAPSSAGVAQRTSPTGAGTRPSPAP